MVFVLLKLVREGLEGRRDPSPACQTQGINAAQMPVHHRLANPVAATGIETGRPHHCGDRDVQHGKKGQHTPESVAKYKARVAKREARKRAARAAKLGLSACASETY